MAVKVILYIIRFYQRWISPLLGPSCRFYPTCSSYAYAAFSTYGVVKGSYFAIRRLVKCHPFHRGGYDPLP